MEPLELLFAAGVTVAMLSILSDTKPELFLGLTILMLIATLVEMWGIGLLSIILVGFLLITAAFINLTGTAIHGIIQQFDLGEHQDQVVEFLDDIVFDDETPNTVEDPPDPSHRNDGL